MGWLNLQTSFCHRFTVLIVIVMPPPPGFQRLWDNYWGNVCVCFHFSSARPAISRVSRVQWAAFRQRSSVTVQRTATTEAMSPRITLAAPTRWNVSRVEEVRRTSMITTTTHTLYVISLSVCDIGQNFILARTSLSTTLSINLKP